MTKVLVPMSDSMSGETEIDVPAPVGGVVVDFVRDFNLVNDATTNSAVPVDVAGPLGVNPVIVSFTTTKNNQRIEMRAMLCGTNDAAGTQGFAISFALDGGDVPAVASSGPVGTTSGTAALLHTLDIPIAGPHTVSLRWRTFGAGNAFCHAALPGSLESASLSVWGYTP